MSGWNLVVHRRTPNQRRAKWRVTNGLQRSVVMVGRRRDRERWRFTAPRICGIGADIDAAFPLGGRKRSVLADDDCVGSGFGQCLRYDATDCAMTDVTVFNVRQRRAPPRIDETKVSQALQDLFAGWRLSLKEPFKGLAATHEIERGLFPIRTTGASVQPLIDATECVPVFA